MNANRRRALALLGAGAASVAGCLGTQPSDVEPSDDSTESPTTETTPPSKRLSVGEWYETSNGLSVQVEDVRIQRSVVYRGPVHTDVASFEGAQFVVVSVAVQESSTKAAGFGAAAALTPTEQNDGPKTPPSDEFRVEVDGERSDVEERRYNVEPYDESRSPTAFAVPVLAEPAPESVRVVWTGGDREVSWGLGGDAVAKLGRAPEFEVRAFEVPEKVEKESSFEVAVTVANTGERDGTFVAELGATTISDQGEIRVAVPEGKTVTRRETLSPYYTEGKNELTLQLDWGRSSMTRTTQVIES